MKIGILTFHRALNYGAVLQCYALFEILKSLGHEVEVIDYRPWCIEKDRKPFDWKSFKSKNFRQKVLYCIIFPFRIFFRRKAVIVFDTFLKEYLNLSSPIANANDIPSYYDFIIFGSDQIWSPSICKEFNAIYFGQFAKQKTKFISYAASLEGFNNFTSQQWNTITTLLQNFDAISVREKSLKESLIMHTHQKIEWVVDPTLLIKSDILKRLVKVKPTNKYVLLFTVQEGTKPYDFAQYIAKEEGCTVIRVRISARLNFRHKEKNVFPIYAASPERFVEYINNAEYVVTNSFHATAISLQLKKNFIVVECNHPNRMLDLLHNLNIKDRYVTTIEDYRHMKEIDYNKVDSLLNNLSSESKKYITTNLL